MASLYPIDKPMRSQIPTPLTLTAMQRFVGGFIKFIELSCGDLMVVNEAAIAETSALNVDATKLAGKSGPVYGTVIFCEPSEIE